MSSTSRPVQSVTNVELYNRWAKIYDTDGNILQALDDALLPGILDRVFALLPASSPLTITELGCGTGRNTAKLLSPSLPPIIQINALDLSPEMLNVARERCSALTKSMPLSTTRPATTINFHEFDALQPSLYPTVQTLSGKADMVLSTLVLEHLSLDVFVRTIRSLLKKDGGYAVITNMHAEMGRVSQAGFVDGETGKKVRGESCVYEVQEVLGEAKRWGFELVGEIEERGVRQDDIGEGKLMSERGRKWIGTKCWFGFVLRLPG